MELTPKMPFNCISVCRVSTSFHLQQGQNLALLKQKGNWFKAQITGFLSPFIIGNSSLQYTGLQDTCGGREKQRWQTATSQSTLKTDVSDTDVSPGSYHWKWHKIALKFYLCEKKPFTLKNNTMSFGKELPKTDYTLNWFKTVIHCAIPVPWPL